MRGRVMALYSVVFLGSTPIGGPLAGWLSEAYDPRVALLLAARRGRSRRRGRAGDLSRLRSRAAEPEEHREDDQRRARLSTSL